MIGSDAQKYFTLQLKKELIATGFFSRTRNPNYLGEILIYLSFGILAESYVVYGFLILVWMLLFHANMIGKEVSMTKKEGYGDYKKASYYLLPKIFANDLANLVTYFGAGAIVYSIYWLQ